MLEKWSVYNQVRINIWKTLGYHWAVFLIIKLTNTKTLFLDNLLTDERGLGVGLVLQDVTPLVSCPPRLHKIKQKLSFQYFSLRSSDVG